MCLTYTGVRVDLTASSRGVKGVIADLYGARIDLTASSHGVTGVTSDLPGGEGRSHRAKPAPDTCLTPTDPVPGNPHTHERLVTCD